MKEFVEVTLDNGTSVYFQTQESSLVKNRTGKPQIEKATSAMGELKAIAIATEAMCASLREKLKPDEFTMEIGIAMSGDVGWFFAKSGVEASMTATVTWKSK